MIWCWISFVQKIVPPKWINFLILNLIFYIQDWLDIDFGIAEGVDFIAISFVKSAEVINHLKSYIAARSHNRYVLGTLYFATTILSFMVI